MAILNKYKEWRAKLRLIYDKYYDFVLSRDMSESILLDGDMTNKCLSSYFDFTDSEIYDENGVHSLTIYEDSVNNGVVLSDIGLTGIDNGLITYNKSTLDNEKYIDILTNSKLEIPESDKAFHLYNVTGNTGMYSYDYDIVDNEYISFKGGFLQGFYKLFGFDYEVLPNVIEDEWNLEFTIRPRDYQTRDNTLNNTHKNTDGIFFYIGTRAENKFAQLYNVDLSEFEDRCEEPDFCSNFIDGIYFGEGLENLQNEYISKKETLGDIDILTSEGNPLGESSTFEIETDNKFLTYNRTKTGYTVNCGIENEVEKEIETDNKFLTHNRTKTGHTVNCDTDGLVKLNTSSNDTRYKLTLEKTTNEAYDIRSGIENNSFALKINNDGSIGYRYMYLDCVEDENGDYYKKKQFVTTEEYSYPGMIKKDEWNVVNVKLKMMNGSVDECGNSSGNRVMKVYVYVNGYLKLVSKDLPELSFKELDETFDKQEGVPFNISLGGGTQGLCDSILFNYYVPFTKILPIEKNFAGTFIGDIRSFKFYTCKLQYNEIKNNYTYEMSY